LKYANSRFFICVALSVHLLVSADLPTETQRALAQEWKDQKTVGKCLEALGFYATHSRAEGLPEDPDLADADALRAITTPDYRDLYKEAQKNQAFLKWLIESTTLKDGDKTESALTSKAQPIIDDVIYNSPDGKAKLGEVDRTHDDQPTVALYFLLLAYPRPKAGDMKKYMDDLETLRALYALKPGGPDALFKIVTNQIQGTK